MNNIENEVAQAALSEEESFDSDNDYALDSIATVFPSNMKTEAEEENYVQIFWNKDGSCW